MKVKLIYIGKTTKSFLTAGEAEYFKRMKRYIPLEIIEIPDIKNVKNRSKDEIKTLEGEVILKKIDTTDKVILLDERGKEFSSVGFSKFIQKEMNTGTQKLVFIIGGAYGFSDSVYKRSDFKISLSKLTFSHQMVRMFFLEQLYRAFTIINNKPYHHE